MYDLPIDAKWRHGFVSFPRAEDAARAIDELDGHVLEGTPPIRVNWSRRSRPSGTEHTAVCSCGISRAGILKA